MAPIRITTTTCERRHLVARNDVDEQPQQPPESQPPEPQPPVEFVEYDDRLIALRQSLNRLYTGTVPDKRRIPKSMLRSQLVQLVQPYVISSSLSWSFSSSPGSWPFPEQVDLTLWIPALNAMDAVLRHALKFYAQPLLLIPPIAVATATNNNPTNNNNDNKEGEVVVAPTDRNHNVYDDDDDLLEDDDDNNNDSSSSRHHNATPPDETSLLISDLVIILQFWSLLLRHSYAKPVCQSIAEWTQFLAAADDALVAAALNCIAAWVAPCQAHWHAGLSALLEPSSSASSLAAAHLVPPTLPLATAVRCLALARGWGTRTHALGLAQVLVADAAFLGAASNNNSSMGSAVPNHSNSSSSGNHHHLPATPMTWPDEPSQLHHVYSPEITIHLDASQMVARNSCNSMEVEPSSSLLLVDPSTNNGNGNHEDDDDHKDTQKHQKRRRVIPDLKSTAEIFAMALDQLHQKQQQQQQQLLLQEAKTTNGAVAADDDKDPNLHPDETKKTNQSSPSSQPQQQQQQQQHSYSSSSYDDRLFGLLADVRLARSYRYHMVPAVELRLAALVTLLQQAALSTCAPLLQELVTSYIQAQPELVVELVDLLRPTVSATDLHPTPMSSLSSSHPQQERAVTSQQQPSQQINTTTTFKSKSKSSSLSFYNDAIAHLAQGGQVISFRIRWWAVQALTALVARRDQGTGPGTVPHEVRVSTVLTELGVGKGLYMGVLPTLLRYSLAAITTASTRTETNQVIKMEGVDDDDDYVAMDIGLAFLEGTYLASQHQPPPQQSFHQNHEAPPSRRAVQVEQALIWLDGLLQLTMAVASTPTGTAALTESGMVPALLSLVALDTHTTLQGLLGWEATDLAAENETTTTTPHPSVSFIAAQLCFVTAQAVQILESMIMAQSNAAAAFHDLEGVPLLTERLAREMTAVEATTTTTTTRKRGPSPSQRVLLFSLVTCLTVVFHQESNSSNNSPNNHNNNNNGSNNSGSNNNNNHQGSSQLKQPALANAVRVILTKVSLYGGHLASLVATLLSDVLNHDPHMVHYVHEAGIAQAFFDMMANNNNNNNHIAGDQDNALPPSPQLPPVPELIMSIPNVVAALALTEDGAKAVKQANPFPALCSIFYHPQYAMPASKCLLNELTAIVGTGLEEIMRHVEGVKPLIMGAIVQAMERVVALGTNLSQREAQCPTRSGTPALDTERSCLIQYVLNMGQLLEQVLHNDDHVEPFCQAGGLTALLALYQATFPKQWKFLAHVSPLSSIAVSTLHHSTIEDSLILALKCIFLKHNPLSLLQVMTTETRHALDELRQGLVQYLGDHNDSLGNAKDLIAALPNVCLYDLDSSKDENDDQEMKHIAQVLESYAKVTWVSGNLALVLKAVGRRMDELTIGGSSSSSQAETLAEWRNTITAEPFVALIRELAQVQQDAIWQVCQARARFAAHEEQDSGSSNLSSLTTKQKQTTKQPCHYRLRIVCPEGAVVRNGIEIDSCASVGSMEMGEIVQGTDRCINSSGILRYRTERGWISEMTRGHGREPITEVIHIWRVVVDDDDEAGKAKDGASSTSQQQQQQRVECPIPSIPQVAVSILARLQRTYGELFTSLSRLVVQAFRSMGTRNPVLEPGSQGGHVVAMLQTMLYEPMTNALKQRPAQHDDNAVQEAGTAMFYGCLLDQLLSCLFFEERRERRMVNVLLLAKLVGLNQNVTTVNTTPVLDCIQYIWNHCLADFVVRQERQRRRRQEPSAAVASSSSSSSSSQQRVGRSVAACFPPVVKFLRRLMSTPIASSPVATVMSRIKWKHLQQILSLESAKKEKEDDDDTVKKDGDEEFFQPEALVKCVQLQISESVRQAWVDERFALAPPHLMHPVLSLVGDVIVGLEEEVNKKKKNRQASAMARNGTAEGGASSTSRTLLSDWIRRSSSSGGGSVMAVAPVAPPPPPPPFVVSEEAIARLEEMGFGRDHAMDALERTQSNRIEVAMEYALTHPPPDPATAARRRAERELARQQREEAAARQQQQQQEAAAQAQAEMQQQQEAADATATASTPAETNNSNENTTSNNDNPGDSTNNNEATSAAADETGQGAAAETSQTTTDESGRAPMDVDEMKEEEEKDSEESKKKADEDDGSDKEISAALQSWVELSPTTCCKILAASPPSSFKAQPDGDAESEALTVVVSSFLLDLCHRYPDEKDKIVLLLLDQLKSKLLQVENSNYNDQYAIAKLTHAVVLFIKALPKVRLMVLQRGLVTPIVARVESFMQTAVTSDKVTEWPMWLPHFLLLLDIMAQPVVMFSDDDYKQLKDRSNKEKEETENEICDDYYDVLADHKSQSDTIAKAMSDAFSALRKTSNLAPTTSDEDNKPKPMPAYFPLLPLRCVDVCLNTCRRLIGCEDDEGKISSMPPPPGVLQASLMLLLHLLRTPAASTECIKEGVVEAILSLGGQSRFTGNSGLVTLILRRLLEDESTLLAAMETEIRTTVSKLAKTNGESASSAGSSKKDGEVVSLRAFIEAATPLLCRDASAFLKAMSLTLKIEGDVQASDPKITLLPVEERTKKPTAPPPPEQSSSSASQQHNPESPPKQQPKHHRKSPVSGSSSSRRRSGSLRSTSKGNTCSSGRRSKRDKAELQREESVGALSTPAALITCQLVERILSVMEKPLGDPQEDKDGVFLEKWELLGILSDLILAVPSCASSVHNYRPHRSRDKRHSHKMIHLAHALPGSPAPTKSFVNFLLHVILAQDRWSMRSDDRIWNRTKREGLDDPIVVAKKKAAAHVLKTSQAAARVLLALCARPGEGRRRVIADLTFALSGGHLGQESQKQVKQETTTTTTTTATIAMPANKKPDTALHALYAWGELCLGLAVPRGGGKNLEASISINYEIVRIMFECGMVHALMYAVHIVPFDHEMASSTFGTLLLPLEILTRANVSNFVTEQVQKESAGHSSNMKTGGNVSSSQQPSGSQVDVTGPSDAGETSHYYETAGGAEAAVDNSIFMAMDAEEGSSADDDGEEEGVIMELEGDEEDNESEEEDSGEEEGEEEEEEGDEEMSEDEEPSENEMSENEDEEEEDEEEEEEEEEEEVTSEEVDDEGDWNLDYEFAFGPENAQPNDPDEGVVDDSAGEGRLPQHNIEEGWTRIESNGFGGMLLGGFTRGDETDRARGFIDAAEAMIGTLLRSGEINQDSIAEIEGQLGIRIMGSATRRFRLGPLGGSGGDPMGETTVAARMLAGRPTTQPGRNGDVVGTLPHVHQRSQPDAGYSSFGGSASGRLADLSSIEIVFGGPSVTAGSRNYDIHASEQTESEEPQHSFISQLDLQLFPGGPASAAVARAQHSLHPLLCGVDLPPINALVMDLFPHGVRARRTGQLHTRRPGDWTSSSFSPGGYLVSTATGNIIRSNRSHSGAPLGSGLPSRSVPGPIGWTDDGLPFDATVEQLGTTLQTELTRSLREQQQQSSTAATEDSSPAEVNDPTNNDNENAADTEHLSTADVSMSLDAALASEESGTSPPAAREGDAPSTASEGEHVASSLANGLRLSSASDDVSGVPDEAHHNNDEENAAESEEQLNNAEDAGEEAEDENHEETNVPGETDSSAENEGPGEGQNMEESNENEEALVCPPNIEPDVFHSLPREMQRDVVNEYASSQDLAAQLDGTSLDPEVLAALPEEMRQEVIEQERRQRMRAEQATAPADPSRAEEMDNASFIASLAPELRAEILVTADEETLSSLPPNLVAEANVLRERAAQERQRAAESSAGRNAAAELRHRGLARAASGAPSDGTGALTARKKPRTGKFKVEADRESLIYMPDGLSAPFATCDVQLLLRVFFMLSPIRPQRLPHKLLQNLSGKPDLRLVLSTALLKLLHEDGRAAAAAVEAYADSYRKEPGAWRSEMDSLFSLREKFPPASLIGVAPELSSQFDDFDGFAAPSTKFKQSLGAAVSVASNMPKSTGGTKDSPELPPVVAGRLIDALLQLCKSSPRFCAHALATKVALLSPGPDEKETTCLESIMDLIQRPRYLRSSTSLDQLLSLLESVVAPLSQLPRPGEEEDSISKKELDAAATSGKEWVDVPAVVVSPGRLQAFCSILRIESCRESAFMKVNMVLRRLCRVDSNRRHVLAELASVAHSLGEDAVRDLKALKIRMEEATVSGGGQISLDEESKVAAKSARDKSMDSTGKISSSVTFSTSTSEMKLLRVLQTLQSMCSDIPEESQGKKGEGIYVTEELVHLLRQLDFGVLWDELSSCLKIVQVLEGVATLADGEEKPSEDADAQDEASAEDDGNGNGNKKLRNSSAGILTRFLPSIEAFFVATASATKPKDNDKSKSTGAPREIPLKNIVGATRLIEFVGENRVLLNALIRNNAGLLDRGLRALVQVPRCRAVLDFDVKRHWFKTQVRRLRQHASRRHGNIRLHINRKTVFEEAYHQLRLRNADEMRGRLHITFRDEEGIDAGGLSREFFAILAKEMFNPNYALFTSTEDGCTFQPNPNSSINPDHLSYFRFCGRIVGKAVADGYLLDAHFTRSLYKHMLGIKPSHHDMEAIDPDYYRNLKTILEYNLEDIGLELFFSIDDNSFGRRKVIDLLPNGRTVPVTEENKEEYVQLVCEHRMTTAIQNQIKAYLDGFYELVSPDLIAIFTPRELELVISGLPDIDVDDLKKNTDYIGWKATDKEIQWFWNVMSTLSRNQKAAFLQFVTGSSKVPLAGFGELQGMRGVQKFSIHKVTNQTKGALMSAHTCFNSLDLPTYTSEEETREKLLYAINEGAGSFLFA